MTLNSKVLSLVLLSGLAMGGAYAKKSKLANTDWTEESQTVQWSNDKCDAATTNNCDKNDCKSCEQICNEKACNNLDLTCPGRVLNARADLNAINVIDAAGNVPNSLTAPKGINTASIEAAWSADLDTLHYRVTRCGDKAATTNGAALINVQPGATVVNFDPTKILTLPLSGSGTTTTTLNDTVTTIGCLTQLDLANNLSAAGSVASTFSSFLGLSYNFATANEVIGALYTTVADIGSANKPLATGSLIPCNG